MDLPIVPKAPKISRQGEGSTQLPPLTLGQGNGRSSGQLAPSVGLTYDDSTPIGAAAFAVGQGDQPSARQFNQPPAADLSSVVDALTALTLSISSRLGSDTAASGRDSNPLHALMKQSADVFYRWEKQEAAKVVAAFYDQKRLGSKYDRLQVEGSYHRDFVAESEKEWMWPKAFLTDRAAAGVDVSEQWKQLRRRQALECWNFVLARQRESLEFARERATLKGLQENLKERVDEYVAAAEFLSFQEI